MNKFEAFEDSFHAQLEVLSRERPLTLEEKITLYMRRLYRAGEDFILGNMDEYRGLIQQAEAIDERLIKKGERAFMHLGIDIRNQAVERFTNRAFSVITDADTRTKITVAGCQEAVDFWREHMQIPDAPYMVRKYGPQRDRYFRAQIDLLQRSTGK